MTAVVLALIGIGALQLPRHWTLNLAAGLLFICALLIAFMDQAGI